jgi:hypothetical protein
MRSLREDVVLQLAQGRPGVDAEVVGEPSPCPAQRRQRVALAPGLVQREREQRQASSRSGCSAVIRLKPATTCAARG